MEIANSHSQWEFAVWLRELKQGLCDNLEGWDVERDGREVWREGTWVYLWLILIVWQKTTKYCKAIILQLKKNLGHSWWRKGLVLHFCLNRVRFPADYVLICFVILDYELTISSENFCDSWVKSMTLQSWYSFASAWSPRALTKWTLLIHKSGISWAVQRV